MDDRLVLTEAQQVKALVHPLRRRILEVFADSPMTPKQASERLGEPATRMYHHVRVLERAGLIRVVEERRKRGTIERYYRAVAREIAIGPGLFASAAADEAARGVSGMLSE